MKKRVVSWLLVVLMLTSLLPTSVLAEMAEGAAQAPAAEEVLPETPEVPESPESPGTPEEPAQPETSEQPEQPEGEEQTSAPQLAPPERRHRRAGAFRQRHSRKSVSDHFGGGFRSDNLQQQQRLF